jgi:putative endonuclease
LKKFNNYKERKKSYHWGIIAEYLCAAYLILKGYNILRLRYRNHAGEIDIIAAKGKLIIFTEVKARKSKEDALFSVTPAKQQILINSASGFIATNQKYAHHSLRFDMMVVTSPVKIYHLKDAWRA